MPLSLWVKIKSASFFWLSFQKDAILLVCVSNRGTVNLQLQEPGSKWTLEFRPLCIWTAMLAFLRLELFCNRDTILFVAAFLSKNGFRQFRKKKHFLLSTISVRACQNSDIFCMGPIPTFLEFSFHSCSPKEKRILQLHKASTLFSLGHFWLGLLVWKDKWKTFSLLMRC